MFVNAEMKRVEFDVLSSEFGCKRFYATNPPVYYILDFGEFSGQRPSL